MSAAFSKHTKGMFLPSTASVCSSIVGPCVCLCMLSCMLCFVCSVRGGCQGNSFIPWLSSTSGSIPVAGLQQDSHPRDLQASLRIAQTQTSCVLPLPPSSTSSSGGLLSGLPHAPYGNIHRGCGVSKFIALKVLRASTTLLISVWRLSPIN